MPPRRAAARGYALAAAPGRVEALRTAAARGAANAQLVSSLRRFDDSPALTRALGRCDRVAVRDQRGRALMVDEFGLPVDRVVDARRAAVGADDIFVTVDDGTMRAKQLALFPAHPTPPAASPPAGFRFIAAHDEWRALVGPARR